MRFDLYTVLSNFAVIDGMLYRKYASGLSLVKGIERGRLVSMVDGTRYFGPEVAYACLHKVVPLFPIVQLDSNPHNMTQDNLFSARLRRLRYRVSPAPGGFRHPLSRIVFETELRCRRDWNERARLYYMADRAYVCQLEDAVRPPMAEIKLMEPVLAVRKRRRTSEHAATRTARPVQPENVFGRDWHWYKGAWVNLPKPVHVSDDWMVRAAVLAEHPTSQFAYDPVLERTTYVVPAAQTS